MNRLNYTENRLRNHDRVQEVKDERPAGRLVVVLKPRYRFRGSQDRIRGYSFWLQALEDINNSTEPQPL